MTLIESGKSGWSLRARWIRNFSPSSHSTAASPRTTVDGSEGCVASSDQVPTSASSASSCGSREACSIPRERLDAHVDQAALAVLGRGLLLRGGAVAALALPALT